MLLLLLLALPSGEARDDVLSTDAVVITTAAATGALLLLLSLSSSSLSLSLRTVRRFERRPASAEAGDCAARFDLRSGIAAAPLPALLFWLGGVSAIFAFSFFLCRFFFFFLCLRARSQV